MLRSKMQGSAVLHRLTEHRTDLAVFVLFSSISGVWGSRLQIHYGAANAYQDALVRSRRARGLPGLSIAWGPWGGRGGLSDLEDNLLDLLRRVKILAHLEMEVQFLQTQKKFIINANHLQIMVPKILERQIII